MTEWVPVEGFPTYEVSSMGEVRNRGTGYTLKPQLHPKSGLWMVFLRRNNVQHTKYIHRLVASAFLHPEVEGRAPVHIDGNRDNNSADNLEWRDLSTAREITADRNKTEPTYSTRVMNRRTGEIYENALEAARAVGGLEKYIILSAWNDGHYKGGIWSWYR